MITQRNVDRLGPGEAIWDAGKGSVTGFGARRQRGPGGTYVLKYRTARGGQRWHTIGRHGSPWTPETARAEAKRLTGVIVSGCNPAAEREVRKAAPTLAEIAQRFLEQHAQAKLRPKTAYDYKLIVEKVLVPAFGRKAPYRVDPRPCTRLYHARRETPVGANRAVVLLKAICTWADPDGVNPCRHIKPFPERARERFLSRKSWPGWAPR